MLIRWHHHKHIRSKFSHTANIVTSTSTLQKAPESSKKPKDSMLVLQEKFCSLQDKISTGNWKSWCKSVAKSILKVVPLGNGWNFMTPPHNCDMAKLVSEGLRMMLGMSCTHWYGYEQWAGNIKYQTGPVNDFLRTEVVVDIPPETEGRGRKINNDRGPQEIIPFVCLLK